MAEAEEVPEEGEVEAIDLPDFGAVARAWEEDASLRHRLMDEKMPHLTRWQDRARISMANTKSMALNVRILEILAGIWCPLHPFPRAIPVDFLRKEARRVKGHKIPGSMSISIHACLQVKELRRLLGRPLDPSLIHLDGSGIKALFSRGIRRFRTQRFKSRALRLETGCAFLLCFGMFVFFLILNLH